MTLVLTDNFDRADSALGGVGNSWIDPSTKYQIVSNKARVTQAGAALLRPLADAGTKPRVVASATVSVSTGYAGPGAVVGCNAAGTSAYNLFFYGGTMYLRKGTTAGTDLITALSYGVVEGNNYRVDLTGDWSTAGQVVLTYKMERFNGSAWVTVTNGGNTAAGTVTDSSSPLAAGYCGVRSFASGVDYDPVDIYDEAALALGEVLITSISGSTINLSAPNATGGSHSYTYQWYRYDTPAGTANAISGATSQTLSYTPADGNLRWYKCRVSDGFTTADSAQKFAGSPFPAFYCAVAAPEPAIPTFSPSGQIATNLNGVVAGDSISVTGVTNLPARLQADLQAAASPGATVTLTGTGHSGTTWADWLPTAVASGTGQSTYDATKNNFNGAVKAATDHSATVVFLMLGTNDRNGGRTLSAASADADTVVAAFAAAGLTVVLSDMPWEGLAISGYVFIEGLNAHLHTLVNGTTIVQGQTASYRRLPNHYRDPTTWPGQTNFIDSIHPADVAEGTQSLAAFIAKAYLDAQAHVTVTETARERGQAGQSLHVTLTGATSTSSADFTVSAGSLAASSYGATASPVLSYTAPSSSQTVTLTHVASGAFTTFAVTDTAAPNSPTGVTTGAPTLFTVPVSFTLPSASPAGETVTGTAKKNGSTVTTGLTNANSPYSFTGVVVGDILSVLAVDDSGNVSSATSVTFNGAGGAGRLIGSSLIGGII